MPDLDLAAVEARWLAATVATDIPNLVDDIPNLIAEVQRLRDDLADVRTLTPDERAHLPALARMVDEEAMARAVRAEAKLEKIRRYLDDGLHPEYNTPAIRDLRRLVDGS